MDPAHGHVELLCHPCVGIFFGLITCAVLIRTGRTVRLPPAGWFAALAFGTLGYPLYYTLEIRGYGLMMLLESAFLCCYLRWLEDPAWRRSLPLLALMLVMPYVHFVLLIVVASTTLHLLFVKPRRLVSWIILGGFVGVAFSPIASQALEGVYSSRASALRVTLPESFRLGPGSIYQAYSAHCDFWLGCVTLISMVGLYKGIHRIGIATFFWLLAWAVVVPSVAFMLREEIPIFIARYLAFTIPFAVLLLAVGLDSLPIRRVSVAALGILALTPWRPFDHRPSYSDSPPISDFMRGIAQRYQPGDHLVVDPDLAYLPGTTEWHYYMSIYAQLADFHLDRGGESSSRRVWYLRRLGAEDPDVYDSVRLGRVLRTSWGDWTMCVSLFEAPPEDLGIPIGESWRFLGADIDRLADVHTGDLLPMRSWWTMDLRSSANSSLTFELYKLEGVLVADSASLGVEPGMRPFTVGLSEGEIQLDAQQIHIPYDLKDGWYHLDLAVLPLADDKRSKDTQRIEIDRFHLASFAD